jgi:hypothetical protein
MKGNTKMVDQTKAEAAQDKKDEAAYKKYEAEQADHEKKHPGEIDEAAYAKYEKGYDKAHGAPKMSAAEDSAMASAEKPQFAPPTPGKAKLMTVEEKAAADAKAMVDAKAAEKKMHAERLAAEKEHLTMMAGKIWFGRREVKVLREAEPDDMDFSESVASSVVQFLDDGTEATVPDAALSATPRHVYHQ